MMKGQTDKVYRTDVFLLESQNFYIQKYYHICILYQDRKLDAH